jgi:hypothetical protein
MHQNEQQDIKALAAKHGMEPDEYRRVLLAEYAEIGSSWRNDVETAWRFYALIMAPGLAALYFATINHAYVCSLGLPGVAFVWFALLFYRRQGNRNQIRWNRAHEIERMLGMRHHLNIDEQHIPGVRLWTLLRILTVLITFFWFYLALPFICEWIYMAGH